MEERVQLWVGVAAAIPIYFVDLLSLWNLAEQRLVVLSLSLVFHSDGPHTSPQLLRLRDDCRHLWIIVARGAACSLHGSHQIDNSSGMSNVENAQ